MTGYNSIGLEIGSPRGLLDVEGDISNGELDSVFGRMTKGDSISEGTFLGVREAGTSLSPGNGGLHYSDCDVPADVPDEQ